MNDIARLSIERPLYSWMLVLLCIVGGVIGIDTVGRLEAVSYTHLTLPTTVIV